MCIFLDALASGGITTFGETISALRNELKILENFEFIRSSIVIIDDARGIDGSNSYPDMGEIYFFMEKVGFRNIQEKYDMLILKN